MQTPPTLSYIDSGSGLPVLLGHSYLFDKTMWSPQMTALAKQFRVIVPDLWGHGESPALPAGKSTMADLAADHLQIMDALGIEEFAIVGLSVGGMWGAELAAMAPERVKALMLIDTFVGSETDEAREKYFAMLNAIDAAGTLPPPLLEYVVSQFYSHNADPSDVQALKARLGTLSAEQLRESIVPLGKLIFGRPDRMAMLEKISCPVQVATGELDLPRPPLEGQLMAEKVGCEFSLIPSAAHISNRENPEFVTPLIIDFLTRYA